MRTWARAWVHVMVPRVDRGRFLEEWQANVQGAEELGLATAEVEGAAVRQALRQRERWVVESLALEHGVGAAVLWWLVAVFLVVGTGVNGAFALVLLGLLQGWVVTRSEHRTGLLAVLLVGELLGTVVGGRLFGMGITAADDPAPDPWYLSLWWPLLGLGALCFLAFWAVVALEVRRQALTEAARA